jgi:hypothetical protein
VSPKKILKKMNGLKRIVERQDEKYLEKKLTEEVKKLGGMCLKFGTSGFTGMPDRIILHSGRAIFVELKGLGRKQTLKQQAVSRKLAQLGFTVWVIDSHESLEDFLSLLE